MFSPIERMMAWRYLRARKAEGFVSVIAGFSFLGIMLGVATLIIVMSVMNGFRAELVDRILGLNGHLNVYSQTGPLQNYMSLVSRLENIKGVESVRPMVEGQVLISVNGMATGAMVRAMSREDFATKPIISDSIVQGELTNFKEQQVAIGSALAKRTNLKIGDDLTLLAPKGKATPFGTIPRSRTYKVGLIFDVGMFEYNNGFVFMDLPSAQQFFQLKDAVNSIEVMATNENMAEKIKPELLQAIDGQAGIYDWRESNSAFLNALDVERNVMFLILTLIIVVAAFNIISSMIMLVKDKGKDIAILRTMGATQSNMLKIFTLTGASIGFSGTLAGAVLGIAFAKNIETIRQFLESITGTELFADEIYFLSQLPAIIDWQDVIAVVGMAFTLSITATIYPAWRASRLDPVEALRYE
ncbi:MAG: lipoprotein-releasing ABC transporter permease subunit [Alphaproteobacteria bacterium]|nr:lipoprotein-releasing ABC transporter permease subunit [Alphaproteobacteria bacterium]